VAAGSYALMLASTADRDRAIEVLKASFVEGRLTKDELDHRVGQALVSRMFPELMAIISDLPLGPLGRLPAHPATPAFPLTSRLAVFALACAVAAPVTAGITAIPAIVAGHMARRRIRRTGQNGIGIARAAVALGWLALLVAAASLMHAA
jgi:hypothetical protein